MTFPKNRVLLAVSNTATITNTTTWTFFFFVSAIGTHTNCLADFPTPGIDANAVYIGVNQFCGAFLGMARYGGSDVFVVQKSSVLGGGSIHVTGFQSPSDVYTPQGVDNPDPAAIEGWVLGDSAGSFNRLNLVRVSHGGTGDGRDHVRGRRNSDRHACRRAVRRSGRRDVGLGEPRRDTAGGARKYDDLSDR